MDEPAVLDADAHPDVIGPREIVGERQQAILSFGEDLEHMPVCSLHDLEDRRNVFIRYLLVEEVAHRVDKDEPGAAPSKRLIEPSGPEAKIEALLVWMVRDAAPALGEGLRVTVRAARRDLGAARPRVPSRLRPFDRSVIRHRIWSSS